MERIQQLTDHPIGTEPVVLTIGNYDGVHRGHQAVLSHVVAIAKKNKQKSAILTYSNHPAEVLHPGTTVALLCTRALKERLFEQAQIDLLLTLPFDKQLSQQSVEHFLHQVYRSLPFTHLILGHDATIGRAKEGTPEIVRSIVSALGAQVEYIPAVLWEGERISSRGIRSFIQSNDLKKAADWLGREYSIYAPVVPGITHGKRIGFPTANIEVAGLCIPPLGVYAVRLQTAENQWKGVANLGFAPTVRKDHKPLLEVHLFDCNQDLYGQYVEVTFCKYIRPEKTFPNLEELKQQIKQDVEIAKNILL